MQLFDRRSWRQLDVELLAPALEELELFLSLLAALDDVDVL